MATYLTPEGLEKMEAEIKKLTKQKRGLSKDIEVARAHGDLKENAEYHAAKERLQLLMEKLNDLTFKMGNVQVIDPTQSTATDTATMGMQIKVKDLTSKEEETYILVGADESDPASGKISVESPLGRAFLGKKVKEKTTVELPVGKRPYQILSVQLPK